MKKIDGTLYSPIDEELGARQKMYVETVPEAIIMNDGSTLKDKIYDRDNGIVVSNTKPEDPCLWINPYDISVVEFFDFSDVTVRVDPDDTPIHTLRTPTDKNGLRSVVYPLTSTDAIHVNDTTTLDNIFNNYDMGFAISKTKPNHKAIWANYLFDTVTIDDFGVEEEVFVMNDFLTNTAIVDGQVTVEDDYIFEYLEINGEDVEQYTIVFFDNTNPSVILSEDIPNTQSFWIEDLYHTQSNIIRVRDYFVDTVVIDGRIYNDPHYIINVMGEDYSFLDPSRTILSDDQPVVNKDTLWCNTSETE